MPASCQDVLPGSPSGERKQHPGLAGRYFSSPKTEMPEKNNASPLRLRSALRAGSGGGGSSRAGFRHRGLCWKLESSSALDPPPTLMTLSVGVRGGCLRGGVEQTRPPELSACQKTEEGRGEHVPAFHSHCNGGGGLYSPTSSRRQDKEQVLPKDGEEGEERKWGLLVFLAGTNALKPEPLLPGLSSSSKAGPVVLLCLGAGGLSGWGEPVASCVLRSHPTWQVLGSLKGAGKRAWFDGAIARCQSSPPPPPALLTAGQKSFKMRTPPPTSENCSRRMTPWAGRWPHAEPGSSFHRAALR